MPWAVNPKCSSSHVSEPVGANITMAFAQFGKVLAALGSGRHAYAYASAERLFDPADPAYHVAPPRASR